MMKKLIQIGMVLGMLAGPALWAASPPLLVNYQGVLRNASGNPLTGTYDMTFSFFDAVTGGTLLLTDAHTASGGLAVSASNGLFNATLGGGALTPGAETTLENVFKNHTAVYLAVQVGSETLSPRVQVLSAAYAQACHSLDGMESTDFAAAVHNQDASTITTGTLAAGRGGTGLAAPGTSGNVLTSNGTGWVSSPPSGGGDADAVTGNEVTNAADGTLLRSGAGDSGDPYKLRLNLTSANTWSGAQTFSASTNFPSSGIWNTSGYVGIGTATPQGPLDLGNSKGAKFRLYYNGNFNSASGLGVDLSTTYEASLFFGNNSSPLGHLAIGPYDGTTFYPKMWVQQDGMVGIGTTTPASTLDVNGSAHVSGAFLDSSGSVGSSGQVLKSTITGTQWGSVAGDDDAVVGNEVTGAYDTTLARTGTGTSDDPFKLQINLANANTWTGGQAFHATTTFAAGGDGVWDSQGNVGMGTFPAASNKLEIRADRNQWQNWGIVCLARNGDAYNAGISCTADGTSGSASSETLGGGFHATGPSSGTGITYGVQSGATGSGTGAVYGLYGAAQTNGLGTAYGVYGTATASGGGGKYAGYFSGDVRITGALKDSAGSAGTSGQVLQSMGSGGTQWATSTATNADTVDSLHASATATANYLYPLNASSKFPNTVLMTGTGNGLDADTVDSYHAGNGSGQVPVSNGTVNSYLNADAVDGFHVSSTAAAGYLYPIGTGAKFPNSVLWTGSGNGLDADLLDGQHGSYYQSATNINAGTLAVARGGTGNDTSAAIQGSILYKSGTGVWTTLAPGTDGQFLKTTGGNAVQWDAPTVGNADTVDSLHASSTATANYLYPLGTGAKFPNSVLNTGTGNGLDADLLDGQHGSYYQSATNINAGTLADARLSTNVALLNNTQTFSGAKTFSANTNFPSGIWNNSGNVGIGTTSPHLGKTRLDVEMVTSANDANYAIYCNSQDGTSQNTGISSSASSLNVSNTSAYTVAGNFNATGPGSTAGGGGTTYGINSSATSYGTGSTWGGSFTGTGTDGPARGIYTYGHTTGSAMAYGIYAEASAGSSNYAWAGYFNSGKVYIAGYTGLGTSYPSYRLELTEDSAAKPSTNTWTIPSDARLKKDISPFTDGLSVIEKINPVTYKYNGLAGTPADKEGIGVLAQEIKEVAPYTVGTYKAKLDDKAEGETELYDFNSHALTFVLINAVKELDERTKSLASSSSSSSPSAGQGGASGAQGERTGTASPNSEASPSSNGGAATAAGAAAYPVCEPVEAGDVLVADAAHPGAFCLGRQPSDRRVVGIAASVSQEGRQDGSAPAFAPMATSGIVVCKADATSGPIEVGDLLVTSPFPGHAMRAVSPAPGTVLGKAIEPLEAGTGVIQVLVMLR